MGWEDAKCRGMDPSLFVDYAAEEDRVLDFLPAPEIQNICQGCPCILECDDMAVSTRSVGWFGGRWHDGTGL